jgi:hypothetical protein
MHVPEQTLGHRTNNLSLTDLGGKRHDVF